MHEILVGFRDVFANQDAQLLYRNTQLLGRLGFRVLSLILLGGERACVHGSNAF
jgi:hypothetical protein